MADLLFWRSIGLYHEYIGMIIVRYTYYIIVLRQSIIFIHCQCELGEGAGAAGPAAGKRKRKF